MRKAISAGERRGGSVDLPPKNVSGNIAADRALAAMVAARPEFKPAMLAPLAGAPGREGT